MLSEYITITFVDTYQSSLPLLTYVYSPCSSTNNLHKPLILLLHGAGGDHHQFDDVFPTLIKNGYYVMVCDLRYHGQSQPKDRQTEPEFDVSTIFNDLDRALAWFKKTHHALFHQSIVLGGISMGGMIAQAYAHHLLSTHNGQFKIHALLGIGCAHIQIPTPSIPWLALYKTSTYNDTQAMIPVARQSIIDSAYSHLGKSRSASSLCLVDDAILFYCFRACANVPPTPDHSLFTIPQLLIRGEFDQHTEAVMQAWYINSIEADQAKTTYKVIPNAGHLVTVDKGHLIADHILQFLSTQ